MNLGFNSNVRVGDVVYHVQTEDRGSGHPFIDTTVYSQGRVLHRRTTSYEDLLKVGEAALAALEERVEKQHREIIEELRAGTLQLAAPSTPAPKRALAHSPQAATGVPAGIAVQLLNPASWLVGGAANLQVEVRTRAGQEPAADVDVQVLLEGAEGMVRFTARTNAVGRVDLNFPLPQFGPGGASLVISAAGSGGEDEIRYQLRHKTPAPTAHVK